MPGDAAPIPAHAALPDPSDDLLAELEKTYKDFHANPELSMQEHRTSGIAAAWLKQQGYDVTGGVGGTGVVGLLRNGDGATVVLRADMDALPIEESTGLPYASQAIVLRDNQNPVVSDNQRHVHWLQIAGIEQSAARSRHWRWPERPGFTADCSIQTMGGRCDLGLTGPFPAGMA